MGTLFFRHLPIKQSSDVCPLAFHFQSCFFTPTGLSLLRLGRCTLQLGLRCQLYDDIKRAHLLRPPLSSIVSALEFSDKQPTCSALSQRLRFFLFDFTPCPALKPEATSSYHYVEYVAIPGLCLSYQALLTLRWSVRCGKNVHPSNFIRARASRVRSLV